MLRNQLRSEWMRGRGRPVEKYSGALAILAGLLIPIVMILISSRNPSMRSSALDALAFPASLRGARSMAALLGPFLAAALGANVVGAEYQYGTWPWLLVRSASRLQLVVVKVISMSARIVALTVAGVFTFIATAALLRMALGVAVMSGATTAANLWLPFISVGGAMAFAAVIGLLVTVASKSVAFGTLVGAFAQPLLLALRFKETAPWIPYVHLQNIEEWLLAGRPGPFLTKVLGLQMSARSSVGVIAVELFVLLAAAYLVFRRQEIVY